MTKKEFIERYGEEKWENHRKASHECYLKNKEKYKQRCNNWLVNNREKYNAALRNNRNKKTPEERKLIRLRNYCKNIELVENFELAKADNFKGWVVHHRLENYWNQYTLKRKKLYYSVNPECLIFLRQEEHGPDTSQASHHPEKTKWHKRILEND